MTRSRQLADFGSALDTGPLGMRNYIINGGCRVAQRGNVNALVNTRQFGGCDRIYAYIGGSTVTAGVLQQAALTGASNGLGQWLAGVSGTGITAVQFGQRIEQSNARRLAGKTITASVLVYHDMGSAINANLTIRKPNAADDYTGMTTVATQASVSIPSGVLTQLRYTVQLGATDGINGLEVLPTFTFGSTTLSGRSFAISDFSVEEGLIALPFERRDIALEVPMCRRYWRYADVLIQRHSSNASYGGVQVNIVHHDMRVTPIVTWLAGSTSGYAATAASNVQSQSFGDSVRFWSGATGPSAVGDWASARFSLDAEI